MRGTTSAVILHSSNQINPPRIERIKRVDHLFGGFGPGHGHGHGSRVTVTVTGHGRFIFYASPRVHNFKKAYFRPNNLVKHRGQKAFRCSFSFRMRC